MSRAFRFARLLAARLREGTVTPVLGAAYVVKGRLDIGVIYAAVEFVVPWDYQALVAAPPFARCLETWMRQEADWHNASGMCWVLHDLWRDAMSWEGKPARHVIREGLEWMLRDVTILINRHYFGHMEGLTTWPAEWLAWGHGDEGVRQYRGVRAQMTGRTE